MLLSLFLTLFLTAPIFSQATGTAPNILTPKEISEGWVLLFDGATEFGWHGTAAIKAADGKLELKGNDSQAASARPAGPFHDFEISFEYIVKGQNALVSGLGKKPIELEGLPKSAAKETHLSEWTLFQGRLGRGQVAWTVPANSVVFLRNVKLRPLHAQRIFNGKDLTGWKIFPAKKSKFTVTPDGAINIQDGPGDLQTEGRYDDFVLQLECISNGKHLNSGVFLRCRPNEYQNGYEAQIRNQFTKEPTQDYTIEEYDPATHQLIGKKKAKFTAVDYGTGAIYRRQPARKEVAKDGEWFTFTILAHKNHFMTWVNGIEVADWSDNRPPSDNARNGCRLEAGHLSLQGHDPTTDLSFRNFRIAEIK